MNGKDTLAFKLADKDAKTEKLVVAFKEYIMSLGKSENFARLGTAAIRGFFSDHRMPLKFTHGETEHIQKASRTTTDYRFTREDLAKMANPDQTSLTERYILLVGKSVGLRAGDFLSLTYGRFKAAHLDGEAPIALGEMKTAKEHVPAFPFLDSDSVPIVRAILEQNPEAENSAKILDLTEESLTGTLQRLFGKAHLESGDAHVRFHNLRKYLIDRLSAVASESQWKQIVGKQISESAYVSQEQLRDVYLRAMPAIVVNGSSKNHAKLEELESAVADLKRLLGDEHMKLVSLEQKDMERSKEINELKAEFESLTPEERKKRVVALRERKQKKEELKRE